MIENQHILKPGERFSKEMEAPERPDILIEVSKFDWKISGNGIQMSGVYC